jgi:hypothetical protein
MNKITSLQAIAGALLAFGLSAAPAHAANRTWVSGMGTDSGACTRAAPCRSFAFALTQTAAGGEIDVLDPAGYGPVTITKAISIVNDGVGVAAIGAPSGNAITINAGPSDSVHLRGLTIAGFGTGQNGIKFTTGGNLAIENCVVRNFTFAGINISPSDQGSKGGAPRLPVSVAVTGVLSKVITSNNSTGINMTVSGVTAPPSLNVTIVDSEASNNSEAGIAAFSLCCAAPVVMLRNVVASYNGTGLSAASGSVFRVAHSVVTGNVIGVSAGGGPPTHFGTLYSYAGLS